MQTEHFPTPSPICQSNLLFYLGLQMWCHEIANHLFLVVWRHLWMTPYNFFGALQWWNSVFFTWLLLPIQGLLASIYLRLEGHWTSLMINLVGVFWLAMLVEDNVLGSSAPWLSCWCDKLFLKSLNFLGPICSGCENPFPQGSWYLSSVDGPVFFFANKFWVH